MRKKLTQEIFLHPECPTWAKWAAMDTGGRAFWYESEPELHCSGLIYDARKGTKLARIPGKFYSENGSKIKRQYTNLEWLSEHPEELAKRLIHFDDRMGTWLAPDGTFFYPYDTETGIISIDKAGAFCLEYTLNWLKQEHKENKHDTKQS